MNNITPFRRGRRVPARQQRGPWDSFQKPKALPLWAKVVFAFIGAVFATQIGVWQYRDHLATKADPDTFVSSLFSPSAASDSESAAFGFCHTGGGVNCVVDGDTLYYQGIKIRIADIDTPETHDPGCAAEAIRGAEATKRLHALVNAGPFSLETADRDEDRYGRKLRVLTRDGQSLGEVLVDEGLARWYAGGRQPWC